MAALVAVCGLPASGKTTLSRQLEKEEPSRFSLFHFDDVASLAEESERESRRRAQRKMKEKLKRAKSEGRLLLLDDIFYLRSMRRPLARAAFAESLHFLCVFVECDMEKAIQRDSVREKAVGEKSIRRIAEEMEIPEGEDVFIYRGEEVEGLITWIEHKIQEGGTDRKPQMAKTEKAGKENIVSGKKDEMEARLRRAVGRMMRGGEANDGKRMSKAKAMLLREMEKGEGLRMRRKLMSHCFESITLSLKIWVNWKRKPGSFVGVARSRLWVLKRKDESTIEYTVVGRLSDGKATCSDDETLRHYLQLEVSLEKLYSEWSKNEFVAKLLGGNTKLKGIRILAQPPLETTFAFICSANNNIKRISQMVNRLAELYGSRFVAIPKHSSTFASIQEDHPELVFDFPSLDQMNTLGMEVQLRKMAFGYRAAYIRKTVEQLRTLGGEEKLEQISRLREEEVVHFLRQLSGVGPKVADCIRLMSLGHSHVVPLDTHMWNVTKRRFLTDLPEKSQPARHPSIAAFYTEEFGRFAGWTQAILFNSQLAENTRRDKEKENRRNEEESEEKIAHTKEHQLLERVNKKRPKKTTTR